MDVVECQELTKFYGNLKALNKLSFKLQEDKITGLIGRNGAGKTSLLRIIAGFMAKSSGEIKVFADNPFNNILVSANTIYINDNMPFPLSLNLSQILDCADMFYKNWDGGLARRLFEHFSLNPKQYYRNLSKGMKGTFNVIVGMSAHCALTIYDEPITGMDSAVRKDFYRALLRDYIEHPRTIIMSSHHLDEIQDVIEDILLIKDGEKCLQTSVSDLKESVVGLKGSEELIEKLALDREVFYRDHLGKNSEYIVVKNNFNKEELQKIRLSGVEIVPVNVDDICIYLTAKSKGGIDNVFDQK